MKLAWDLLSYHRWNLTTVESSLVPLVVLFIIFRNYRFMVCCTYLNANSHIFYWRCDILFKFGYIFLSVCSFTINSGRCDILQKLFEFWSNQCIVVLTDLLHIIIWRETLRFSWLDMTFAWYRKMHPNGLNAALSKAQKKNWFKNREGLEERVRFFTNRLPYLSD